MVNYDVVPVPDTAIYSRADEARLRRGEGCAVFVGGGGYVAIINL